MIDRIRKESWKNLKLVLLLVLAISMSLSLSGVTFADDDSICCEADKPEDAPPPDMLHAPSPTRSESLASASSSSNIQTFRTDTGPELDWYQPCNGGDNEIDFNISVQGINLASVELARLTLAVWDVDFDCGSACGGLCERDTVYINGNRLTTPVSYLTGANQQWSTVTFDVDPAWLTIGENYIQIFIDTLSGQCWCVTCDWGELSLELEEVDVKVDEIEIIDDISIRDNSGNAITDPIWSEDNPSLHKPVADASKDSLWIITWPGSLKIKTHLDAEPLRPSWDPKCKYGWWVQGTNKSDTGEFIGWDGEFTVPMPEKVGKYELTLMYEIYDDQDNQINFQSMTHDLYVTHKKPKLSDDPKTNWLDKGCAWGNSAANDVEVVTNINSGIYNESNWEYYLNSTPDWSELVEGSTSRGNCWSFANVWCNLSKCIGVLASLPEFHRGAIDDNGFITIKPATALDRNPGNAYPEGSSLADANRWLFSGHQVGQYGGLFSKKYYDPTTGNIYNSEFEYVQWDLTGERGIEGGREYLKAEKSGEYVKAFLGVGPWGAYEYFGPYPSSSIALSSSSSRLVFSQAASSTASFTGVYIEKGIDSDGSSKYNYLSIETEIEVTSSGEYGIYGTLFFNGEEITSSPGAKSSIPTYYHLSAEPGIHEATLQFSGEDIYKNRKSGNYTVELRLIDNSGLLVDTLSFDTSNYLYTEFGETPALIVNCSDQGMDTNADGLYEYLSAKVSIKANLSGEYFVEVGLYAADGNMINVSSKRVALSGSEDVDVLLDGQEIRMSRQDGPYVLSVTLTDSDHNQIESRKIQTAKYSYMEFQTSTATFTGNYNDYGEDTDGDDLFDNLTIEAEVDVVENGKYTAKAILTDSMGDEIVRAEAKKNLPKGNSQIVLKFDGVNIHRHGKDGPYMVKSIILYAEDLSIVDVKSDAYTTSPYRSADFDGPSSFFQHFFSDYGEDTNSDGYYESLVVEVGVDVVLSGNYLLRGVLYDQDGKQIALANAETYLNLGSQSIKLRFNGFEIYKHAVDGHYSLGYVILCTDNSSLLDSQADAYTTSAYSYKDFQHPKVFLTGKYDDYGTDTDSDGIYEYLVVDMEVFVKNAGNYALNARLMDGDGNEMVWASTTAWLPADQAQIMQLNFDGESIYNHGANGPYYVRDVYVYNMANTAQSDYVYDAYTTTNHWPVGNKPPTADAGPDQTVESGFECMGTVTLNGSGSTDPDGDSLSYSWTWDSDATTGISPTIQLPLGTTTITLVVNDGTEDSEPDEVDITVEDTTPPATQIISPVSNQALQDGVILTADASDVCDVAEVYFYVREADGGSGGYEDLLGAYNGTSWECNFDTNTSQTPDGYYVILTKAVDTNGNEGWSTPVPVSIRNWAVVELLPNTANNKAGRTMPVKFALRIAAAVDPAQPFVYNEELEIRIYDASAPDTILQTSLYGGDASTDYRIDTAGELYITNFKTMKQLATYVVEIWRMSKNFHVGSFTFETVK